MESEARQGGCEVDFGVLQGLGQGCAEGPELLGYQPLRGLQTGHHCLAPLYFTRPYCLHRVYRRARRLRDLDLRQAPRGLQRCYGAWEFLGCLCGLRRGVGVQELGG